MTDTDLIQITEAALADSYRRAGAWMVCAPGCSQCCVGVFPISTLDATRLREALAAAPPDLAARIRSRAAAARIALTENFPGDPATGTLFTDPAHEEAFEDFANDAVCPVLDPASGQCDLYAARPLPCRTFGPPMPAREGEDTGIAVCELCFVGAPPTEVARCQVDDTFLTLEQDLLPPDTAQTLIAFALR